MIKSPADRQNKGGTFWVLTGCWSTIPVPSHLASPLAVLASHKLTIFDTCMEESLATNQYTDEVFICA